MEDRDKKWKVTKISTGDEYSEELTYANVCEMLLSGSFMTMLKRMPIGEELIYNEKNLKFLRIE